MSNRRPARRAALVAALLGTVTVLAGLGVLPPTPVAQAREAGSVTVDAPGAGPNARVTVSRTTSLVNQTVAVSWSGFRPSSATRLENSGDALDINTDFPVRVYQCRGDSATAPASSSDCYGAPGFRGIEASGDSPAVPPVPAFTYPGQKDEFNAVPDGPANWQDAVTGPDGTGEVAIQLFTKRESAALGCDAGVPCSLVVVPNYGRDAEGTRPAGQGATEDVMDAPWAWARRTVIPLQFLPVGDSCPLTGDSVRVEGSPVAAHALASWRARTCTLASSPVRIDYTSIGEPQTRGDVASGTTDVGLVIDPLPAEGAAGRGVVYAPVAVTGLVAAYQIDDAHGRPVRDLKLNARLVAKLVTASYRSGGNAAVANNPVNLFRDPEFLQLNPGVDWPGGAPGNHPLLLGDLSDTTLTLTRWLAADKDAAAFLAGKPDPWGMTVNRNYKGVNVPFAGFPLLDQAQSSSFQPVQEMDALARQLSIAQFPGALVTQENGLNVVTKPPRQNAGRREVIGFIDAASAANFRLSTASLRNASGEFVAPTDAGLLAGIASAKVNADGTTRTPDPATRNPRAYPLPLLVSAALSTKADKADRSAMADLLDYVVGDGQVPGQELGQLPEGYAPLSADLAAQLRKAKAAVLKGYVAPPATDPGTDQPAGNGGGGAGGGVVGDLGGGAAAAPASEAVGTPAATDPKTASVDLAAAPVTIAPVAAGRRLVTLPLLGLVALVMLVAGPGVLLLSRTGHGPRWLNR